MTPESPAERIILLEKLNCLCGSLLSVHEHSNGLFILRCPKSGCMSYCIPDTSKMFRIEERANTSFEGFMPPAEKANPVMPIKIPAPVIEGD